MLSLLRPVRGVDRGGGGGDRGRVSRRRLLGVTGGVRQPYIGTYSAHTIDVTSERVIETMCLYCLTWQSEWPVSLLIGPHDRRCRRGFELLVPLARRHDWSLVGTPFVGKYAYTRMADCL